MSVSTVPAVSQGSSFAPARWLQPLRNLDVRIVLVAAAVLCVVAAAVLALRALWKGTSQPGTGSVLSTDKTSEPMTPIVSTAAATSMDSVPATTPVLEPTVDLTKSIALSSASGVLQGSSK